MLMVWIYTWNYKITETGYVWTAGTPYNFNDRDNHVKENPNTNSY